MTAAAKPGFLKRSAAHGAALDRVKEWVRARFALPDDAALVVAEVSCQLPGCPPLETAVAFWTEVGERRQFKIFKPVEQVREDDLPPAWMKDALIPSDGCECGCC
jgi:hypothetical protein